MNVLIRMHNSPTQHFLVTLPNQAAIDAVERYLGLGKYSKAIMMAFSKGEGVKELNEKEASEASARLILTPENAHWDLTN